jgi:integral membrane protein
VRQPKLGSTSAALTRYRVMAYVVGVGLVLLVFVGVPLQLAGHPGVEQVVGEAHGFLYIVYLVAALDLARRSRFTLWQLLQTVGAGLVPFLAFYVERRTTSRVRARLAAADA